MRSLRITLALALAWPIVSQEVPKPGSDGRYTISAAGIKAQFIPYGATLTNLFVNDKGGKEVDVVLGYDDAAFYATDKSHPTYNSIPGRYANRIGKAQFTIDDKTFKTQKNDGQNTLHSGINNWSYRVWSVAALSNDSITFSLEDKAGASTGMPGTVNANVTYSVANATWSIKMVATSSEKTPLMLTHHTYFNLDAYKDPASALIWNHTLYMPTAKRYLAIDTNALPTGQILTAAAGSINDFASKPGLALGKSRSATGFRGNCGGSCEGYNGFWIFDEPAPKDGVLLSLASPWSGVKADLRTNQAGVVLYTCAWSDGTANLKKSQGVGTRKKVEKSSCIAIEAQDYVDGINHKEWGRVDAEITGPGKTYLWESSWSFGMLA